MDVLFIKSQLAWIACNVKAAQDYLDNGNSTAVHDELDFAERAIARGRGELASARAKGGTP